VNKRYTIPGMAIGLVFMLASAALADVHPTNKWKSFLGDAIYNGQLAPKGSIIDAYDPDGVHCGTHVVGQNYPSVDTAGVYGMLAVYGDDVWSPDFDEGAEPGNLITFTLNHRDPIVTVVSGDLYWQDFAQAKVNLAVNDAIIALTMVDPPVDRIAKHNAIVHIPIGLRNDGNGLDFYSVEATSAKGWDLNLPKEFTYAAAGETVYASFEIETPLWPGQTESDRTDTVSFAVYSELDPTARVEGSLVVIVDAADVYAIALTDPPLAEQAEPGETVQFMVGVRNVGNVADEYSIDVVSDLGWVVNTDTKGSAMAQPGELVYLSFEVTIPGNAFDSETDILSYSVVSSGNPAVSVEGEVLLTSQSPTDVDDIQALLPNSLNLAQNYPNPFNPTTTIAFTLPSRSRVNLEIIDMLGRTVERLDLGVLSNGGHSVEFDGSALASGVYFYRLVTDLGSDTRKMVLLK